MFDHVCWLTANVCWINPQTLLLKYAVWISPMGSRPVTLQALHLFLTSAIIKWWLSSSWGLRKMTTWYCYKMKIGFYHQVTWRGHSTTAEWRLVFYHQVTWRGHSTTTKWWLVFIIKLLEGDTQPLQNEDCFFIIKLLEGDTPPLQNEIGF